MAHRITIQDIADELGLSRNTVSKALNNTEGLAEATRTRILKTAMDMGYRKFAYASAIMNLGGEGTFAERLGDKHEVALFSTTFLQGTHFASLMLDALQNELSQLGFTLDTHRVTHDNLVNGTLPLTFKPERAAAIVCVEMFDRAYDEMVCAQGIPTLFVDGPANLHGEQLPSDQLYMESTAPVTCLVNGLLEQGYRRIGFAGNWEHCQSFYERYCAYRLAMLMAGVEVEPGHLIRENYAYGIASCLDKLDELPDAIVCANDFVALDTIQALHSLGLDAPRDIALAGFDDSAESRRSVPQLTTIHIHTQAMAYSAVQLLRTRMTEPTLDFRHVYTQTELIWRESTARV